MPNDDKRISRGRFKGKRITFASTARIEDFTVLANEFMEEIFELLPGEYLISDESELRDFTEMGSSDTADVWRQIKAIYGVEALDVGSGVLVNIFSEIVRRRNLQ